MGRRVVVTGIGLICGVGNTTEEVWKNLLAGKSGVARITDRHTAPWQRLQRWKTHATAWAGAFQWQSGAGRYEFEALVNDVPELGRPMSHPQVTSLGRALQALDLAGAREAFAHLEHEVPYLNHHPNPSPRELQKESAAGGSAETPARCDCLARMRRWNLPLLLRLLRAEHRAQL